MPQVSIRELQRNAGGVLKDVASSGRPALVTSRGKPVAAVVPLNEEDLEDWVLASAAKFVASRRRADADLAAGETTSLEEFLAKESTGPKRRTAVTPKKATKAAPGAKIATKRARKLPATSVPKRRAGSS